MSEYVTLTAADGHELNAYVALPEGAPVAGLVAEVYFYSATSRR